MDEKGYMRISTLIYILLDRLAPEDHVPEPDTQESLDYLSSGTEGILQGVGGVPQPKFQVDWTD